MGRKYFYPRPPRGGRQYSWNTARGAKIISIHALREEGDKCITRNSRKGSLFLSTPSARRATTRSTRRFRPKIFLSTPSARRATDAVRRQQRTGGDFYPRPPRGGRPPGPADRPDPHNISIHALREEGDAQTKLDIAKQAQFLSTPSARRATKLVEQRPRRHYISIHALREEGDTRDYIDRVDAYQFLSTPSARRATRAVRDHEHQRAISIHALREEGDQRQHHLRRRRGISIHALREEGDQGARETHLHQDQFLSTPSARRATSMSTRLTTL